MSYPHIVLGKIAAEAVRELDSQIEFRLEQKVYSICLDGLYGVLPLPCHDEPMPFQAGGLDRWIT